MRAIVTGGAGFIGSHIAERLLSQGVEVLVIDDLSAGKIRNIPYGIDFLKMNILDVTKETFCGVDWVFHNAASKKNICVGDPEYDLEVNGKGALRMIRACVGAGVKHFVHASTGSVYGAADLTTEDTPYNPTSYYGVSKLAGDRYVNLFVDQLPITILRYFHVYGPRQENDPKLGGVVAVFKRQIEEGGPITIHGTGEQKRVFTNVDDVVTANVRAANNSITGTFNCCSDIQVSINQLAKTLNKDKLDVVHQPPLPGDVNEFHIDNSKIRNHFGMEFKKPTF